MHHQEFSAASLHIDGQWRVLGVTSLEINNNLAFSRRLLSLLSKVDTGITVIGVRGPTTDDIEPHPHRFHSASFPDIIPVKVT